MRGVKYTYDYVVQCFKDRNLTLLSEEYHNKNEKLQFICNKHKDSGIQSISFGKLLEQKRYCKFCISEDGSPKRIPDTELQSLCEKYNFTFLSRTVKNGQSIVNYVCNCHPDKGVQHTTIQSLKNKKHAGCRYCLGLNKKTTEDFIANVSEIHPSLDIISEYKSAVQPVRVRCTICGCEWDAIPNRLVYQKTPCPDCYAKIIGTWNLKTENDLCNKLELLGLQLRPLESFKGVKTPIKFLCFKCGHVFTKAPDNIFQYKFNCPRCYKNEYIPPNKKLNKNFIVELSRILPNVTPLEKYNGDKEKIKVKCNIHNTMWYASPNHLLRGQNSCPKCVAYTNEQEICDILNSNGIEYLSQKRFDGCRDKKPLPFDFFLPQYNTCIEYDGEHHYMPIPRYKSQSVDSLKKALENTQLHDKIKNEYCITHNINLIRIPYWECSNLHDFLCHEFKKYNIPYFS